ncbi:hypothetical protein [Roseicitreum antarcticum]|uniref:Uncharacterized protein n=1 Tax=Roseicitreum antarcticum TaxID=564137 RepID=A0A1H3DYJ0_9RHOB|nr:hypothetical protein [Roseicitreum antarcticum]SDX71128.1 hypothetical protein SAMN04488238_11647 [Roseicitreum antarcticum]
MRSLPLFLEEDGFRAVHACWIDASLDRLKALTGNGVLTEEQLIRAADRNEADEIFILAEQITKGPEQRLPEGWSFTDKDGTERDQVRLQWWNAAARTWRDIAISVPSVEDLPDEDLPETLSAQTYPATARPVFFGHYWLSGDPVLQAQNALCLDYSAGKEGPLVTYELYPGEVSLSPERICMHETPS